MFVFVFLLDKMFIVVILIFVLLNIIDVLSFLGFLELLFWIFGIFRSNWLYFFMFWFVIKLMFFFLVEYMVIVVEVCFGFVGV